MAVLAPTFVAPGLTVRPAGPAAARQQLPPRGRSVLVEEPAPSFLRLTAGAVAGVAIALTKRRYGRRQLSPLSPQDMERIKREMADDFWRQQQSLLRRGGPRPRDDVYWSREERNVFGQAHVSKGINFAKYDDIPVETIGGKGTEDPIATFQDACDRYQLPDELTASITKCGYEVPTPVQKYAIPCVLEGSDAIVTAQTGSGKTAAFLVPIIATALREGRVPYEEGPIKPRALVLAPTRELAEQICQEARRLTFKTDARVQVIYGGGGTRRQLSQLVTGCEILVACPGKLEDFCQQGFVSMENIKFLALDEADRMLDMGFEPSIRNITELYGMPESGPDGRQTIMFSATFAQDMQDMALDYLDPAHMQINVGKVGATASSVDQRFLDCRGFGVDKFQHLRDSLDGVTDENGEIARTIVFTNMKRTADDIVWRLRDSGVNATPIHGDIEQRERGQAIRDIKSGRVKVLVATDVAARGLDLPDIGHVVNFDLPSNGDDYVHRIGRTGRIGNKGVATSLVGDGETSLNSIVATLNETAANDPEMQPAPEWLSQM